MIGLIVLGLALVFFIVIAVLAAKTLPVGQVVTLIFLFLFTLLTLFLTATLLKTNSEFHPKFLTATSSLEREQGNTQRLLHGSLNDPDGEDSVSGERAMAKVEQTARGRVWRNVFRVPAANGIALNMRSWNNDGCLRVGEEEDEFSDEELEPVPDEGLATDEVAAGDPDAAPAGPAASSHGIVVGQYVYGFKEFPIAKMSPEQKAYYFGSLGGEGADSFANQDTKGLCRVPYAYLGKFLVVDANDNAVTLQLQGTPDPGQRVQLESKTPWVSV